MAERRVLGIPSPRVEGEEKVGGRAVYAVDVVLPDMLWVKVLRSPYRARQRDQRQVISMVLSHIEKGSYEN